MISSTSPIFAFASLTGVGYREKSGFFTFRTALSVVCADRIVRMRTSNGLPRATVSGDSRASGYRFRRAE